MIRGRQFDETGESLTPEVTADEFEQFAIARGVTIHHGGSRRFELGSRMVAGRRFFADIRFRDNHLDRVNLRLDDPPESAGEPLSNRKRVQLRKAEQERWIEETFGCALQRPAREAPVLVFPWGEVRSLFAEGSPFVTIIYKPQAS